MRRTGSLINDMKRLVLSCMMIDVFALHAETAEEAYARLSSYRSVWDTNALAYVKLAAIGDDPAVAEAKAKWFVDVLAFPDVTETNRLDEVLSAKEKIISYNDGSYGIESNTNCWYAVADFIARLKSVVDPGWQDVEGESFFIALRNYRQECLEAYVRQYTNVVSGVDPTNAFYQGWHSMYIDKWNREVSLESALNRAKHTMKERFWWFGAKNMPDEVKDVRRSNIVTRAHLTPAEEHFIFDDKPDFYYKIMGIKRPRDGGR